jgi:3',5'-cyclic AMP phosphodiesterase CpdA
MNARFATVLASTIAVTALGVWIWSAPDVKEPVAVAAPVAKTQQALPKPPVNPLAKPERVLLTWADDPARSQAVTWRTEVETPSALGQIAVATPDPKFTESAIAVTAATQPVQIDGRTVYYHAVKFADLRPNTLYGYRVGDGTNWSEWSQFRTASASADPFTFIYVGDAQNDILSLWSRAIRGAFREASKARFIMHAGDLIDRANNDGEWGEWFEAAGWINRMVPSIAVPGNHEYARPPGGGDRQLSALWQPQFEYPRNGVPGLEDTCYYIDYQGVRIIGLDSNRMIPEQAAWLETVLKENPNRWTVATFHHPVFSLARGRDNKAVREHWRPIFDKHRVDLVLQGHDHTYGRMNVTEGINVREHGAGPVYVVSVSGPKMYATTPDAVKGMSRVAEDTQLYQVIHVSGDRLEFRSYTVTDELYDAFALVKRPNGANDLIDMAPATPERRR